MSLELMDGSGCYYDCHLMAVAFECRIFKVLKNKNEPPRGKTNNVVFEQV